MPRKKLDPSLPMLYLVYKITNKINGKIYIGAHKTRNKNDHYMGSGNLIKLAIKKYGKKNFIKEILYELNSEREMYDKEKEIVQLDESSYNLINGGGFPIVFTDEIKQKIGRANAIHQKGVGNSQYGTIWINDGINNKKIKNTAEIPTGYVKGKLVDKQKLPNVLKGQEHPCYGRYYINNGISNLIIKKDENIPEGYSKGRLINFNYEHKTKSYNNGEINSQYGTKWVTNGIENRILKKGEPIPEGFKLGRIMKTGWIWITNGIDSIKHNPKLEIPNGYYKGKVHKK